MQDAPKAVWSIPYVSVAFSPSLKQNFIAYRFSKVSSRPDYDIFKYLNKKSLETYWRHLGFFFFFKSDYRSHLNNKFIFILLNTKSIDIN